MVKRDGSFILTIKGPHGFLDSRKRARNLFDRTVDKSIFDEDVA